jgi:alginate O-acetyltransferase complex protein AlgI
MAGTFLFIGVTWIFFRARTLHDAWSILHRLVVGPWTRAGVSAALQPVTTLFPLVAAFVLAEWLARRHWHPLQWPALPRPLRWAGYSVLLWLALALSRGQAGAFIYFQF